MSKSYQEINKKIQEGSAVILTAEEMVELVEKEGVEYAAEKVDVVTTATFGCMCSSGVFFNIPQPNPPIKMETVKVDGVNAYHGNAAADFYLGVTQKNPNDELIGGGHVIERLLKRKSVLIEATGAGTDCYPRKSLKTHLNLDDFNQAVMVNPRNAYQRYVCAVNGNTEKTIHTYMGKLLPNYKNGACGGVGTISPLNNDPQYQTIGLGTQIFLGGALGAIIGPGTQHNPKTQFGNLMVTGDLKKMSAEFIAGAAIAGYGTSCFIGLGVPIPIINENLARTCGTPDEEIFTSVMDYSTGERDRPTLGEVSYAELKSREIEIDGKKIPVSSTSSYPKARKITHILKQWVKNGVFSFKPPVSPLPLESEYKSLKKEDVITDE